MNRRLEEWREQKRRNREQEEDQRLAEEMQRRRRAQVAVCFRGYLSMDVLHVLSVYLTSGIKQIFLTRRSVAVS